jgi:hypothetical protein
MKVSDEEIRRAKRTDSTSFLAFYGYAVKWEGKHGYIYLDSVKAFRIIKCDDGHYVSCQNNGAVEALVRCKLDDGYTNSVVNKEDTPIRVADQNNKHAQYNLGEYFMSLKCLDSSKEIENVVDR